MNCIRCNSNPAELTKPKICRDCKRKYDREYFKLNSDKILKRKSELSKKRKIETYKKLSEYCKSRPCPCGEDDFVVLEFDHMSPENKIDSISEMVRRGRSFNLIKKELDKCQVLCANCHRRKTAKQFGWYGLDKISSEVLSL